MIELNNDQLVFTFPEVHPQARLTIEFQRTLRIPDDGKTYPLPPGLGRFPLRHVDDFAENVPPLWIEHGGVMFPMYQSEAMWLNFNSDYLDAHETSYPFAVKIATGKINAVSGDDWRDGLHRHRAQDYVVVPRQPWLDGYCVEKGRIRQFVAMPLGAGYSAEEQITGAAEHGGLQLAVYPMKREAFERRFPIQQRAKRAFRKGMYDTLACAAPAASGAMGLAPGGSMQQEIYDDPYDLDEWDISRRGRCFVHIANSLVWSAITDRQPPTTPPTAKQYAKAGLPWFDYYADGATAVEGSSVLAKLKSVLTLGKEKNDVPLPENDSTTPQRVIELRRHLNQGEVREGAF